MEQLRCPTTTAIVVLIWERHKYFMSYRLTGHSLCIDMSHTQTLCRAKKQFTQIMATVSDLTAKIGRAKQSFFEQRCTNLNDWIQFKSGLNSAFENTGRAS